ncbi:hypothetical protein BpHYR1_028922 [Brachionus plicatilis]|uniref:Uncharacterized protein n=1 Tax=Brachionus plicatilis TaxID=10195 RepID=A0A3M7Q1T0_BRAPC|nr:hypothetical protein BpHYR1_028922 [Brachionus plicatilis]
MFNQECKILSDKLDSINKRIDIFENLTKRVDDLEKRVLDEEKYVNDKLHEIKEEIKDIKTNMLNSIRYVFEIVSSEIFNQDVKWRLQTNPDNYLRTNIELSTGKYNFKNYLYNDPNG